MGDGRWEMGSQRLVVEFEAAKKSRHYRRPPITFLLQHSSAPDFWLLGCLAPRLLGSFAPDTNVTPKAAGQSRIGGRCPKQK